MADVDTAPPTADDPNTEADDPTPEEEAARLLADADPATVKKNLLDELTDIVEYMKPVQAKNKRRIRLYMLLTAGLGVSNKEIADSLGVTAESVRQALLKARRGRQ